MKIRLRKNNARGRITISVVGDDSKGFARANFSLPDGGGDSLEDALIQLKDDDDITVEIPDRCKTCGRTGQGATK